MLSFSRLCTRPTCHNTYTLSCSGLCIRPTWRNRYFLVRGCAPDRLTITHTLSCSRLCTRPTQHNTALFYRSRCASWICIRRRSLETSVATSGCGAPTEGRWRRRCIHCHVTRRAFTTSRGRKPPALLTCSHSSGECHIHLDIKSGYRYWSSTCHRPLALSLRKRANVPASWRCGTERSGAHKDQQNATTYFGR